MTPLVSTKVLEQVRARKGEPRVTWPEGDAAYPMTERAVTVPRSKAVLAFGTAEPDTVRFPNNVLTYQEETRCDGHNVEMYRRYEVLPGPTILRQIFDSETHSAAILSTQRILKPSFPIPNFVYGEMNYEPANNYWGRISYATLDSYTTLTRTVDTYVDFYFPRLILAVDTAAVTPREGQTRARLLWTGAGGTPARNGFNDRVKMQTTYTYYATKALADAAAPAIEYKPVFNDLFYDGLFYNANERGVLNDAVTLGPNTTGTNNPYWGYVTEPAVTFAASTPSATAYIALADGTARVVAVDIQPWRYRLWRMEVKKVVLR